MSQARIKSKRIKFYCSKKHDKHGSSCNTAFDIEYRIKGDIKDTKVIDRPRCPKCSNEVEEVVDLR